MLHNLVIIGVGLIGGSFALDLKRLGLVQHVIGVGRSLDNLQRALQLKVIDQAETDPALAVRDADLVLLATPVGQMGAVMAAIAPHLPPQALVCDGGSTKRDVVALYRQHLPGRLDRCVPAHPIAGSDLSGATAARYALYEGRKVVLTPLPESAPDAVAQVATLWSACGAEVVQMEAAAHDRVFATVSHLPHLLAFAYMNCVLGQPNADDCLALAASGFRDFTRIAGSHPEMWRDISLANRDSLLQDLHAYRQQLDQLIAQLGNRDADALNATFSHASEARIAWGKQQTR